MYLDDLATELLTHIFHSCSSITDVINLASTCHRFRSIYVSSRKLGILAQAAEHEYGPLEDAIQVVTQNASQPTHIVRHVPLSMALLRQLIQVGRVAVRWEEIYPTKKWKTNYWDRRLLTTSERYRFRRALYRLWLYTRAFHNSAHPRFSRLHKPVIHERAALLHNWSVAELADIVDVHMLLREVLSANVCPSNGHIMHKFRKRCPDPSAQLMINMHLNYPPPNDTFSPRFAAASRHCLPPNSYAADNSNMLYTAHLPRTLAPSHRYSALSHHDTLFTTSEGWGDAISHYYTIEDMLKLDPAQILYLKEHACSKAQVEGFVRGLGEWFENNGETLGQTVGFVLAERGEAGWEDFEAGVEGGKGGIVRWSGEEDDDEEGDWEEE